MKESHRVLLVTTVVLVTIARNIFIYFATADYMDISFKTEVILPIVCKIDLKDTHGGFHGDGETIASIRFTERGTKRLVNRIKRKSHWKKLDIDDEMKTIMKNKENIPVVENGYYFFRDRDKHSLEVNCFEPIRLSMNYTIAILDTDNFIMYFYELDI